MSQQTAIDWLVEEVNKDCYISAFIPHDLVEQAKQMEKEQMKKTWKDGFSWQSPYKNFEQYYNETYNHKQ